MSCRAGGSTSVMCSISNRRDVPSSRSITSSSREASVWMSSRSIGVMKLLSMRWLTVAVSRSALCSTSLIALTCSLHVLRRRRTAVEHLRRRGEVSRELVEQLEELLVAREKTAEHGLRVDAGDVAIVTCACTRRVRRYPLTATAGKAAATRARLAGQALAASRCSRIAFRCATRRGFSNSLISSIAGDEAADVRPDRDPTRHLGLHRRQLGSRDSCSAEPLDQHDPRRDRE